LVETWLNQVLTKILLILVVTRSAVFRRFKNTKFVIEEYKHSGGPDNSEVIPSRVASGAAAPHAAAACRSRSPPEIPDLAADRRSAALRRRSAADIYQNIKISPQTAADFIEKFRFRRRPPQISVKKV